MSPKSLENFNKKMKDNSPNFKEIIPGDDAAVIKIVNYLISQAVKFKASDIHIEPEAKSLNVRFRVDGVLRRQPELPNDLAGKIASRFKEMAGLNTEKKQLVQDGRIAVKLGNKDLDFRVSFCPTIHGENIVLRSIDKTRLLLEVGSLGLNPKLLSAFKKMIASPYGIILVAGPPGSGKTVTLYSVLRMLNKEGVNIMTVEDPVEYRFPGMRQVYANAGKGITFASALRSFLSQDPDIIMAGEIRDLEAAEAAVQAALTGHIVFSTLNASDSAAVFSSLMKIGIEPFLISSSLLGILSQRLLRRVCGKCRVFYAPSENLLKDMGLGNKIGKNIRFAKSKGCKACNQRGYKGFFGIYELLKLTPEIQDAVLKNNPINEIRNLAVSQGMVTLKDAALDKLLAGWTTPEEVMRVMLDFGLRGNKREEANNK